MRLYVFREILLRITYDLLFLLVAFLSPLSAANIGSPLYRVVRAQTIGIYSLKVVRSNILRDKREPRGPS